MKAIELKGRDQRLFAYVDDEDFDRINQHYWYRLIARGSLTIYARTVINGETIYMHRMVMDAPDGMTVDHIDRDGLNCTKGNMRVVTQGENAKSWERPVSNSSGAHIVKHTLADGTVREYHYDRKSRQRTDAGAKRKLRRT